MELHDIFFIWDRFETSCVKSLELEQDGLRLKLEKAAPVPAGGEQTAAPAAGRPASPDERDTPQTDAVYIRAPLVGTFYAAAAPDKAPLASVGQTVKKGQSICILEAMKMMSEVPAPMDCIIQEVLLQDGELAGYDAPLFRVQPL